MELATAVADLTLDTVEFCPAAAVVDEGVGVVGAYELQEDGATRLGSLALFRCTAPTASGHTRHHHYHHGHDQPEGRAVSLEWLWRRQSAGTKGVLDFKWCASSETLQVSCQGPRAIVTDVRVYVW